MNDGVSRPLSSDMVLDELRLRLQDLHTETGKRTLREIARSAGVSHTTVATVLACRRMPKWDQLEAVVCALDGEVAGFKELWIEFHNAERGSRGEDHGRKTESGEIRYEIVVVSCDIVGHSSEIEHRTQFYRVKKINDIVARVLGQRAGDAMEWTSGGDGGHVVFRDLQARDPWWKAAAIALIEQLQAWSKEDGVKLRITAHAGLASHFLGVRSRVQFVGDGMNEAGWLLGRGGPDGVVVTESFRRAIGDARAQLGVDFHEPRVLRDKKFTDQSLMLMSLKTQRGRWYLPRNEDRLQMRAARQAVEEVKHGLTRGRSRYFSPHGPSREGWELLLSAKRIMQVNKDDVEAREALSRLSPINLRCLTDDGDIDVNPFFADLDTTMLVEVVESGELIQRQYNDLICQMGDAGDTMFVILRGRVGVIKRSGEPGDEEIVEPAYSHEEGEVVGELAFALARNRTADLVALTDTVLLAFNYKQLEKLLPKGRMGDAVKDRVTGFIVYRVLQHVSERVPYLVGPDRSGPLCAGRNSLRQTLAYLKRDCKMLSFDYNTPIDEKALRLATSHPAEGLYILVAGTLKGRPDPARLVDGAEFPLLWANVPGVAAAPALEHVVTTEEAKILYIGSEGIECLGVHCRHALIDALSALV